MVVHRGTEEDYDRWGNFFPTPSWGWKTVLPYFKKVAEGEGGEASRPQADNVRARP